MTSARTSRRIWITSAVVPAATVVAPHERERTLDYLERIVA